MIRAKQELAKRKAGEEADRLFRLALLALSLFYLSREFRRIALAIELSRHFAPVLPAGAQIAGAAGASIRADARDGLQDFFSNESHRISFELSQSGNVAAWRERMSSMIVGNAIQQKTLAFNRPLLPSETLDLVPSLDFELKHLDAFARDLERRDSLGFPRTARAVAARAELYSGSGRAVWFRADERGQAFGVVIYYEAVDDAGTCEPCLDAENGSPYLPGRGFMPGEVCLGRGRCRCIRIPRDEPETFKRLLEREEKLTKAGLL